MFKTISLYVCAGIFVIISMSYYSYLTRVYVYMYRTIESHVRRLYYITHTHIYVYNISTYIYTLYIDMFISNYNSNVDTEDLKHYI